MSRPNRSQMLGAGSTLIGVFCHELPNGIDNLGSNPASCKTY